MVARYEYEARWWDIPGTWRDYAECAGLPISWFFLEQGDYHGNLRAKAICAQCPVIEPCLEEALLVKTSDDFTGIMGGTSPTQRRRIREQQARDTRTVLV